MRTTTTYLAAALLIIALAWGCAPKEPPQHEPATAMAGEPKKIETPDAPVAPPLFQPHGESLAAFLTRSKREQYISSDVITALPPESLVGKHHMLLTEETAPITLARGAADYLAFDKALAIGFDNGEVRVYGNEKCPGGLMPYSDPVTLLAWEPDSRYLLAAAGDRASASVFDLTMCGEVNKISVGSYIARMAVSTRGSWVGLVDESHRLWLGTPLTGNMTQVATMRFETLAVGFTPKEGMLMALDQAGWIVMWATHTMEKAESFQIGGGPFLRGRFQGRFVELQDYEHNWIRWDLATNMPEKALEPTSRFALRDGELTYRTRTPMLVKKLLFGPAAFTVERQEKGNLIRVRDLDGKTRYYMKKTGDPAPPPDQDPVWQKIDVAEDGSFDIGKTAYTLAVPVYQKEHLRLVCRHVAGQGYYLWWIKTKRPGEYFPHPGDLPQKTSLAADGAVDWVPLKPSGELP